MTDTAAAADLLLTREGHIATITLNRPEARNAWSDAMIDLMHDALDTCEADDAIRAVILTGAGKAFCAGGDLNAMLEREGMFSGDTVALRRRYVTGLQSITRRFDQFDKPILAAINGPAIGAGLDLALMCDVRVASERAVFGSTFARVGLIPGDGGAYLLTRAVGFSKAVELVLTARVFDAAEAHTLGITHHTVAPDDVLAHTHKLADQIAALPPGAVRSAKTALYRSYNQGLDVALHLTAALQSTVQHTDEHIEAVQAMLASISKR